MSFTINQYLKNPMGAGSSLAPSQAVKDKYNKEFKDIRSKMKCYWYKVEDSSIAHVLIPSESTEGLNYDVVFEFGDISNARDIKDTPIKVFSNSPSFIFTYAKVFKDQGLLCSWLEDKYVDKVLQLDPTTRNRYKIVSYEKSLYLACLYIASNRSIALSVNMNAITFTNYEQVATRISSERALKNRRNRIQKKAKKEKEKSSKKGYKESTSESKVTSSQDNVKEMKKTSTVPKTKTTKSTPKVNSTTAKTSKTKKTKKVKKI